MLCNVLLSNFPGRVFAVACFCSRLPSPCRSQFNQISSSLTVTAHPPAPESSAACARFLRHKADGRRVHARVGACTSEQYTKVFYLSLLLNLLGEDEAACQLFTQLSCWFVFPLNYDINPLNPCFQSLGTITTIGDTNCAHPYKVIE